MKKIVIITIHGIHTDQLKSWQTKFWDFAKTRDPDMHVFSYKYGFLLAPFSWWTTVSNTFKFPSWFRSQMTKNFVAYIKKVQAQFSDSEVSVIAHSFGTYLTYCALDRDKNIKIRNLVLVAGVISSHIEKLELDEWMEWGRINAVHAWSSPNDDVVSLKAIPPFGKVGHRGFIRYGNSDDYASPAYKPYAAQIYNHRTNEKHGGVLEKLDLYGEKLLEQLVS